jgi:hypothetical protein
MGSYSLMGYDEIDTLARLSTLLDYSSARLDPDRKASHSGPQMIALAHNWSIAN